MSLCNACMFAPCTTLAKFNSTATKHMYTHLLGCNHHPASLVHMHTTHTFEIKQTNKQTNKHQRLLRSIQLQAWLTSAASLRYASLTWRAVRASAAAAWWQWGSWQDSLA
jgi:hypothetical protein